MTVSAWWSRRSRTAEVKRQLFGQKSEKRLDIDPAEQLNLLAGLGVKAPPSLDDVPKQTVTYERRAKVRDAAVTDGGLRFGPDVPVQTIEVTDPAIEAIPEDQREVIGEKVSYRLAQHPSHLLGTAEVVPVLGFGQPAPLTRRLARATTLLRRAVALVAHVAGVGPE